MKVALILTHDCNLRCTYCYVGDKYNRHMSLETAMEAVRFAQANSRCGVDFNFFGGEPLLEKAVLFGTIDYARAWWKEHACPQSLRFYTTTNGLLADQGFLERAKAVDLRITLSLDGHGRGHDLTRTMPDGSGSFAQLAERFPDILRHYPDIQVLTTQTPRNVATLAEGIEKLSYCGFRHFALGPNYEEPWPEEAISELASQLKKLAGFYESCYESGNFISIHNFDAKIASHTRTNGEVCSCCDKNDGEIAIAPSGRLYPCLRFVKQDTDHALVIGSIQEGIDHQKRAKLMLESTRECQECQECGFSGRCFHFCGAVNYKTSGSFGRPPDMLCRFEQLCIETADRMAERLYKAQNPAFLKRFYS